MPSSPRSPGPTTSPTSTSSSAGPGTGTGTWWTARSTGARTCRASSAGSNATRGARRLLPEFMNDEFLLFDHLRFARLCAWLRRREPDDSVGYSILVYRLTDRDVRDALYGPPAELAPEIEVAGAGR